MIRILKGYIVIILLIIIPNNRSYAVGKEFKSDIIYEVDGKEVLKDRELVSIDKNIYLLLEDIEKVLGINIDVQENIVKISLREEEVAKGKKEIFYIESARVVDVSMGEKKITLLPYTNIQDIGAYITLKIDQNTQIFYEEIEKIIPMNMIEKDMMISAKYSLIKDEAYIATQLIIKGNPDVAAEHIHLIARLEIIEVNLKKGYIRVADSNKDIKKIENHIIVYVDKNTNIRDELNTVYTLDKLKIGQKIRVITNGILTTSIPAQTVGLEIIIM